MTFRARKVTYLQQLTAIGKRARIWAGLGFPRKVSATTVHKGWAY